MLLFDSYVGGDGKVLRVNLGIFAILFKLNTN